MDRRSQIETAIAAQEQLRSVVGDEVVDAAIAALRHQLGDATTPPPQRKVVTVLFADIAGFTAWSESADVEEVGETIDAIWQRLDAAVAANGGRIDKHIGDALMAVWGVMDASDRDPERAVRAALEMRDVFAGVWPATVGPELQIRIGVNTGQAILRRVGTTGEYTALGDAVNIASRLEQAAPPGQVLVSHDTYRHIRGVFTVSEQPLLDVRGKREPLRSYLVASPRPRAFRMESRGIQGLETRMVGRTDELDLLRSKLVGVVQEQTPALVTVVGDAGVGKSRLLYEFLDWLQVQPRELFLFRARAATERESMPYGLIRDMLSSRFEVALDASGPAAIDGWVAGFVDLAGLDQTTALAAAHLVGFDTSHFDALPTDPEQLRELGEEAIQLLVAQTAQRDPVVLIVEDLHWADQLSLAMLETLADGTSGPVLAVASARPSLLEDHPDWGSRGGWINLEPLTIDMSRRQVLDLLREASNVPDGLVAAIVAAAAGNPFYVEELIKSLIESGAITVGPDGWEVGPDVSATLATPPTLAALLQARLDRLNTGERVVLQAAAVIGQTFWDESISALLGPQAESSATGGLVSRDLIVRRPESSFGGTAEFAFKHALLHDVTYQSVLRSDRERFHTAAARWLENKADHPSWASVIAYHYDAAKAPEAGSWFVRAGGYARQVFANEEALTAFERALELGGLEDSLAFEAYDGAGEVLTLLARYEEAVAMHRAMAKAAQTVGDIAAQGRAMTGVLFALARIGDPAALASLAEETVEIVRSMPVPDHRLLCEALRGAGWIAVRAGDLQAAIRYGEEASQAARDADDRRGLSLSLNLLGFGESSRGDFQTGEDHILQALQIDRELGNRHEECTSLNNLGESQRLRGDYTRAMETYGQALSLAIELGDADSHALALSNLGGAYVGLGRFAEAVDSLLESIEAFAAAGRREYLSETKRFLAEAYFGLGAVDDAITMAIEALNDGTAAGNPEQIGHAWRVLGIAATASNGHVAIGDDSVSADYCFERSVVYLAGTTVDRAVTLADWARSKARDDAAAAGELWDRAIAILAPLGLADLAGEAPQ